MQISANNQQAMIAQQLQMSNIASDIAQVASTTDNMQLQEVNVDLIKSITEQIPVAIAYEANAGAIKVKNAVADTVLNLKA